MNHIDHTITSDAKIENKKFYQYTAIDEYSRYQYIEAFEEHNTYTSTVFLEHMLKFFPFKVECVQTDNGCEFTKKFVSNKKNKLSMFEKNLTNIFMLLILFILLMILKIN